MALHQKERPAAPAAEPLPPEIARTMRLSIWEGGLTTVFGNWTTGSVLIGYLIYLGATPTELTLAASVPMLAQAFSPLGAWLHSRISNPSPLVTIGVVLGRGIWFLPAILPLFFPAADGGVSLPHASAWCLGLIAVSALFNAIVGPVWTSWMGAVVPAERRGHYFGLRNGIHAVIGLGASLLAGVMLDKIISPLNHQVVFLLSVVFAMIAATMFRWHYVPPGKPARVSLTESVQVPLRDKNFRRFIAFAIYWQFAVFTGSVIVYPYLISHLQLTYTQIAIYQAIAAITTMVCGPLWGRLADKVGNRAVLSITTVIAGPGLVGCWLLAVPHSPVMVWISGFVDGVAWSAINAAVFNLALATAKPAVRTSYLAVYMLATGFAGFFGGLVAGVLVMQFEGGRFTVWGYEWTEYHWLLAVSLLLRTFAYKFLAGVKETHGWRTRDVVRTLLTGWRGAGFPWR